MDAFKDWFASQYGDAIKNSKPVPSKPKANTTTSWLDQGGGFHSDEYDKPVSIKKLGYQKQASNDVGDLTGQYVGIENFLDSFGPTSRPDSKVLPEGRARPNHGLNWATDSWIMQKNPSLMGALNDAEKNGTDYYDTSLAIADVINGQAQQFANARRLASGLNKRTAKQGKEVNGTKFTESDLNNNNTGYRISNNVWVDSDSLSGNIEQYGDYLELSNGHFIPRSEFDKIASNNYKERIMNSEGNDELVDDVNKSKVVYLGDEDSFNPVDSSDGNLGYLIDGKDETEFNLKHLPAFLVDGLLGSLPYFNKYSMIPVSAARVKLASAGYDPDSYDPYDGTYDDRRMDNSERLLSSLQSITEGATERIAGLGASKFISNKIPKSIKGFTEKNALTRIGSSALGEAVEEIPAEAVSIWQDVDRKPDPGEEKYNATPEEIISRMVNAASAGGMLGGTLTAGREIGNAAIKSLLKSNSKKSNAKTTEETNDDKEQEK